MKPDQNYINRLEVARLIKKELLDGKDWNSFDGGPVTLTEAGEQYLRNLPKGSQLAPTWMDTL